MSLWDNSTGVHHRNAIMMAPALNSDALIQLPVKQGCQLSFDMHIQTSSCNMWGFLPHPQLLKYIGLLLHNMNGNCKCVWITLVQ